MAINAKRVYELDAGWGFDGETFSHHFELAHIFAQNSENMMGVEKVRMYGKSHGTATLDLKTAGIEDDFDQAYHDEAKDMSMPASPPQAWYALMKDVTTIIDTASWGLGIKLKVKGSQEKGLTTIEPSHVCQVLVLHVRPEGAEDA